MIVAIDGPSGSGKSSAARALARRLGFVHLDTGAIYRAFTLRAMRRGADLTDERALLEQVDPTALRLVPVEGGGETVILDGDDVTAAIRTADVTGKVHHVANAPSLRERITALVRDLARGLDVVVEGRDTTTAIFPDADVKFYVDAAPLERARRRGAELAARGDPQDPEALLARIVERDRRDRERPVGPLRRAADAVYVDSTGRTLDQVLDGLEAHVRSILAARARDGRARPGAS